MMKRTTLLLFALLIITYWSRVHAQSDDLPEPDPLILVDEQGSYPLGLHIEILEDPGGELTIADVASKEFDSRFVPSQIEVPNFGFTSSAYWLRFQVRNDSPQAERWLLELTFPNMHFVDLYMPSSGSDGFEVRRTGSLRPITTRDIIYPNIVFDLMIPDHSQQTYYLRFENGASMTLPLIIWEPAAFFTNALQGNIWYGIFLGIMVGLLGYNLFLFFTLPDVSYLYLVLLIGGIVFYDISQTSFLEIYIAPSLYIFKEQIIALSTSLIFVSLILFNDSFLSANKLLPRIHLINIVFAGVWIILGSWIFIISYHDLATIMAPTIVVTLVIVAVISVLAWQRGFRATRFLLIAWTGLLVGLLLFILTRMGFIASNFITENSYRIGFVWMAVCWSIALADRINLLKEETEDSNRSLQNAEHRLSQTLEAMPVGVVVYNPDQRPAYTNKRTAEILTNPDRDLGPFPQLERTLSEAMNYYSFRVSGSDRPYSLEEFPVYKALKGEPSNADNIEADLIDWRVPLEVWASPVFDDNGNVEAAVVAFQDITERKKSEMALRASEKRFRVIVENNFDGIAFLDSERKILYVSPSYKQLNGINAEEMIGRSGVGTIHPDDRTYVAETFQKLLQQPGGRVSEEYRIRHQDGFWVWVETRVVNLLDDPHVQAMVLNSRDITERKQREAEIANYSQHLEQLVEERTEEINAINEQLSNEMVERTVLEELLHKRIQWMSTIALAHQKVMESADLHALYEELSVGILQLLDAGLLFLLRWQEEDQVIIRCDPRFDGPEPDADAIRISFQENSPLRQRLELGEIIALSAEQVDSMLAPICACFMDTGMQSLFIAPLIAGKSVIGVLGMALFLPKHELSLAQKELVSKVRSDLTNLAQNANYLNQSRKLVASEERNRLARDLHDSVTQVLFSASLVAEVLPQIWRRDPQLGLQSLEELRRLTRGALAEMRTMLLELRPAAVVKSSLADLLTQLTEASTSRAGLAFRLFIEQVPKLPEEVHISYYRIAQEALNNVIKHARASQVILSLSAEPLTPATLGDIKFEVKLLIEDDGIGFSPQNEQSEHLGRGIMRERAADIKANLTIDSQIGEGTRLSLTWCGEAEKDS